MKNTNLLALVSVCLLFSAAVKAGYIVDTGTPVPTPTSNYLFNDNQYYAGRFTIAENQLISSVEGYFSNDRTTSSGQINISIHEDSDNKPGIIVFTTTIDVAGNTPLDWYGASGLDWDLTAGTYWVSFVPPLGTGIDGVMPGVAPSPLEEYYQGSSTGWANLEPDALDGHGFGFRINADAVSGVETLPVIGWDLQDWDGDGLRSDIGIVGYFPPLGNSQYAFGYLDETGCDNATDGINCIPIAMNTGPIPALAFTAGPTGDAGFFYPLISNDCSESGNGNISAEIIDGELTFQALDFALDFGDEYIYCAKPELLEYIEVLALEQLEDPNKWGVIMSYYAADWLFGNLTEIRLEGVMTTATTSHAECLDNLDEVTQERDDLQDALDAFYADDDGDGVLAFRDECNGTEAGETVDAHGCSLEQFCARINVERPEKAVCNYADFMGDEGDNPKDCRWHGECLVY